MLDFETGILQYFVNEQSKNQKPRGMLSLAGAVVSLSDEAPNMMVVYSANGEMYKLRGTLVSVYLLVCHGNLPVPLSNLHHITPIIEICNQ